MDYIANKILMVRPSAFGFNPETAASNSFQKTLDLTADEIRRRAAVEFDLMVAGLRDLDVEVKVIEDSEGDHTPDSVFPNNWFSTHPDGSFCLYPMEAAARRYERRLAAEMDFRAAVRYSKRIDMTGFESEGKYLEGTGSMVLDHENKIVYASLSSRTDNEVLNHWTAEFGFDRVAFNSADDKGTPIYHTNVLMTLGDNFAVVCLECIPDESERELLAGTLIETGKEIIEISRGQMNQFAGNMILLKNGAGQKILVMSERADRSLTDDQRKKLEQQAKPAAFDLETIEDCGGGSARCMIAELFY